MASRPTTLRLGRQRLLAVLPTISKAYRLVITHLTRVDSKIRHTVMSNSTFPRPLLLPHQSLTHMLPTITNRTITPITTIRVTTIRDTATRSSLIGDLTRITSVHGVWLNSRNPAAENTTAPAPPRPASSNNHSRHRNADIDSCTSRNDHSEGQDTSSNRHSPRRCNR
jgi:hypothetical protein